MLGGVHFGTSDKINYYYTIIYTYLNVSDNEKQELMEYRIFVVFLPGVPNVIFVSFSILYNTDERRFFKRILVFVAKSFHRTHVTFRLSFSGEVFGHIELKLLFLYNFVSFCDILIFDFQPHTIILHNVNTILLWHILLHFK